MHKYTKEHFEDMQLPTQYLQNSIRMFSSGILHMWRYSRNTVEHGLTGRNTVEHGILLRNESLSFPRWILSLKCFLLLPSALHCQVVLRPMLSYDIIRNVLCRPPLFPFWSNPHNSTICLIFSIPVPYCPFCPQFWIVLNPLLLTA